MEQHISPVEVVGNIWGLHDYRHVIVIPTNGTITLHKKAVMGRGLAADAVTKYPKIQKELGERLRDFGNHVHYFPRWFLITFPVKHQWFEQADLSLIQQSTTELQQCVLLHKLKHVLVPRVGCGNGGLSWNDVKPILQATLDARCEFVTWKKE